MCCAVYIYKFLMKKTIFVGQFESPFFRRMLCFIGPMVEKWIQLHVITDDAVVN